MNKFEKLYNNRQEIYNGTPSSGEKFRRTHDVIKVSFTPEMGQIVREKARSEFLTLNAFILKSVLFYLEHKNE